jgi:hypothetical protein
LLLPLVTAAEKKKDLLTAYWLAVAEQSILEPVDTSLYPRLRLPIT